MAAIDESDIYNFEPKMIENALSSTNSNKFGVENSFLAVLSGCIVPKGWKPQSVS